MKIYDLKGLLSKDEWQLLEEGLQLEFDDSIVVEAERAGYSNGIYLSFYQARENDAVSYLFGFTVYYNDFLKVDGELLFTFDFYRVLQGYREALRRV
jgi:hypothetical protein